jgi:hypothetical protein
MYLMAGVKALATEQADNQAEKRVVIAILF